MTIPFILFISIGLLLAAYCMHRSVDAHYKAHRAMFDANIELIKQSAGTRTPPTRCSFAVLSGHSMREVPNDARSTDHLLAIVCERRQ